MKIDLLTCEVAHFKEPVEFENILKLKIFQ